MSYADLLDHDVRVVRRVQTGAESDYGQPVTTETEVATVRAAIQSKTAREVAMYAQAGVAIADHTVFLNLTDIDTTDVVIHDAADCGMSPGYDLPDQRYEVHGVRNAAGRGHHIEVDARLIQPKVIGVEA